jgi:6-phosphogluconolactonase (cycloisomerase 2 family)
MAVPLWLTACGGSDSTAPATSATAVMGAAGGTLTGPDGVQVIVPAGALSQDTTIGIARSSAGAPAPLAAYAVSGQVYELTPHGLTFNVPVTVRAPLGKAADTQVFMASPGEDWRPMSASLVNGVAEWERSSFSWMYTGFCAVPASMVNDPYWCASALTAASLTAAPAAALVQTAFAVNPAFGDWGAYRVDQAANLQFKQHVRVPGNCSNVSVKLLRRHYVDIVHLYDVAAQTVSTQSPTLVADPHYLTGDAIFPVPFTSADSDGNQFVLVTSFDCPSIAGNASLGYSWDAAHPHHTVMVGDGMLVTGNVPQPTVFFTVAGNVSGLSGSGLVLQNNGTNFTPVAANGSFSFSNTLGAGGPYNVTVLTQPAGQTCTVTHGSGTANANISNVAVNCVPSYSIGGTVTGLVGTGLVLQNNGADDLSFTSSGAFNFLTPVAAGGAYNVTVLTQPSGSTCTVTNGSGTANADVTNVAVNCVSAGALALVANSGVTNGTNGLSVYRVSASTGALSFLSNVNAGNTPYAVAITPNGLYAYVTNQQGGTVSSYSIDSATGAVSLIPLSSLSANNASGIAMDRLGRYIWVANFGWNTVQAFAIGSNGVLASAGAPISTLQSLPYAIAAHPTLDFVYVAHSSGFAITVHSVNPADGSLTLVQTLSNAISSPTQMVIDPSGRFAYVATQGGGVCAYRIGAINGQLTIAGCANISGATFAVAVNPNGQYVYATDGSSSGNVVVFAINQTTGVLTQVGSPYGVGNSPRGVAVSPGGNFLYVTNYISNDVSAFSISGGGAVLTASGAAVSAGSSPQGMAIAP